MFIWGSYRPRSRIHWMKPQMSWRSWRSVRGPSLCISCFPRCVPTTRPAAIFRYQRPQALARQRATARGARTRCLWTHVDPLDEQKHKNLAICHELHTSCGDWALFVASPPHEVHRCVSQEVHMNPGTGSPVVESSCVDPTGPVPSRMKGASVLKGTPKRQT